MRLEPQQVAEIRAAQDIYRAGDVARAYEVATSTVTRIWAGDLHRDIAPSNEPPNITTRKVIADYVDDVAVLRARGLSFDEIAKEIGMARSTVYTLRGLFL